MRAERIALDTYVLDTLMRDLVGHDRRASAFVVYLFLWRRTQGGARSAVLSHMLVADGTGLSKRSVQVGLALLERRQLVSIRRSGRTSAGIITLKCPWRR